MGLDVRVYDGDVSIHIKHRQSYHTYEKRYICLFVWHIFREQLYDLLISHSLSELEWGLATAVTRVEVGAMFE